MDYIHSNGPAPGYAIESDSEDDLWEEEEVYATIKERKPLVLPEEDEKKKEIQLPDWKPPHLPDTLPKKINNNQQLLIVLIGEAGLLVANTCTEFLDQLKNDSSLLGLDDYLFTTTTTTSNHRFVLVPSPSPSSSSDSLSSSESTTTKIPKNLQSLIARKLLQDFNPNKLIIFSTYNNNNNNYPSFQQTSSWLINDAPIRFLSSSSPYNKSNDGNGDLEKLGAHLFHVPNLINGFEAALMIQATIRKIDSRLILLPKSGPYKNNNEMSTGTTLGRYTSSLIPLNTKDRRVLYDIIIQECQVNHCQFPQYLQPRLAQILTPLNTYRPLTLNQNHLKDKHVGLMYL